MLSTVKAIGDHYEVVKVQLEFFSESSHWLELLRLCVLCRLNSWKLMSLSRLYGLWHRHWRRRSRWSSLECVYQVVAIVDEKDAEELAEGFDSSGF